MTPEVATDWAEVVVLPRAQAEANTVEVIGRYLASCTRGGEVWNLTSGGDTVLVAVRDAPFAPQTDSVVIVEGAFPDCVGMRFVADVVGWKFEPDRLVTRGVFYGSGPNGRVVATRPELVAALIGAPLSQRSLHERLALDFSLRDRTLFERVFGLLPGQTLESGEQLPVDAPGTAERSHSTLDDLAPTIAAAFANGAALELSGGIDSRLILALGLSGGASPALAFTIGLDGDPDVVVAREICARFGITHLVIRPGARGRPTAEVSEAFVARGAFGANACATAMLPGVFSELDGRRTEQVGGAGGEIAEGFYYTPLDRLCTVDALAQQWVKRRLLVSGQRSRALFRAADADRLDETLTDDALHLIRDSHSSWRQGLDALYRDHRMRQWAGPVLSASRWWYRPVLPLLGRPYLDWSASLDESQRHNRRAQLDAIARFNPELAALGYAGGGAPDDSRLRRVARDVAVVSKKVLARTVGARKRADMGAEDSAGALAADPSTRAKVAELASVGSLQIDEAGLAHVLGSATAMTRELGVLLTAAWAEQARADLARALDNKDRVERVHGDG